MAFGELYLRHPELFPRRRAGEEWGPVDMLVDLPGGPYSFTGLGELQAEAFGRRFAGYVSRQPAPPGAVSTRVFRVPPDEFRRFDLRGFELTLEAEHAPEAVSFVGYDLMARIEWREDGVPFGAFWTSATDPGFFTGALENFFRALVAYRLASQGGSLLHSAAVVQKGHAFVFCGPSGTGKSTLARACLSAGDEVLSDDLNAITEESGRFLAWPAPFTGDLRLRSSVVGPVPVGGICRLQQGSVDRTSPLRGAAAVAAIAACSPYVNADPYRADALLASLDRMTQALPSYLVELTREGDVWGAFSRGFVP